MPGRTGDEPGIQCGCSGRDSRDRRAVLVMLGPGGHRGSSGPALSHAGSCCRLVMHAGTRH